MSISSGSGRLEPASSVPSLHRGDSGPDLGLGEAGAGSSLASCRTQLLSAREEDVVFFKALSRIGVLNIKIIRWDIINVPYCTLTLPRVRLQTSFSLIRYVALKIKLIPTSTLFIGLFPFP